MEPDEATVRLERDGHVAVVTMCRPAKRNAVDRAMADQLDAAFNELEDDDDVWCAVLTGTNEFFCAGSDLHAAGDYVTERGGEYGIVRRRRHKPLIAAVEGFALGGGFEIVLSCDVVVAASTAQFGLPEVKIGVVAACGALFRAPSRLPINVANQLLLTGDPITAQRAYEVGLVNVLAEPGNALASAKELAGQICANAPLAVQASMRAVNTALADAAPRGWELSDEAQESIRDGHDWNEGVTAFFERREPVWRAK